MMIFAPLVVFFAVLVALSFWQTKVRTTYSISNYFLGDQSLKGFVLAMTLVATYGSVSSFVSGPGLAWQYGLGWVVFAAPQIITGFLVLGVLGKKLALVSRRISAVTVIDVLRARYRSDRVALVLSLAVLIFFFTMMIGQFIGGAQIFAQAAGIDYVDGLLLFGAVVVFYTSFGGFRAVAITDAVCAVLMLLGMFLLADSISMQAGGLSAIMERLAQVHGVDGKAGALLEPTSAGALPLSLLFSAWILVGFGTVALPQSAVRCMAYRSTKDLHLAMLIGTVVCGALMIGMTLLGVLARGVIDDPVLFGGNTDALIPYLIANHMSPLMAGLTLIGPLAATMSTVSSLLIAASSAVIKDILVHECPSLAGDSKRLYRYSRLVTLVLGGAALIFAIEPVDVIVWINMFAFGGLEIAFLWPLVLGLFWSRATAQGALASVIVGLVIYIALGVFKVDLLGWHAIVPSILLSLLVFVGVSLLSKAHRKDPVFFP